MNTGCEKRVRNGSEGRRKGPPCWSHSGENQSCARETGCACSQLSLSGTLPRARRFWGYSCRTVHSSPIPLPPPPLGPGSKKVLRWADNGGNSIEFSFGYILKAKVSWTYSQNR